MSHSATLEYDTNTEFPKDWDLFVKWVSTQVAEYYRILMEDCLTDKSCPIHFLRYEDLV
jgi:hypothetical protein